MTTATVDLSAYDWTAPLSQWDWQQQGNFETLLSFVVVQMRRRGRYHGWGDISNLAAFRAEVSRLDLTSVPTYIDFGIEGGLSPQDINTAATKLRRAMARSEGYPGNDSAASSL